MDFRTQMLLKSILDSDARTRLEHEIGYDVVGRIRELASKGVVNEEMRPLIVYLRSVCEEVEK
jgi:hypothetical protein